jgi:hypothetical protein
MVQSLWVLESACYFIPEAAVQLRRYREGAEVTAQAADAPAVVCPPPLALNGLHLCFYTTDRYVERAYLGTGGLRHLTVPMTGRDLLSTDAIAAAIRDAFRGRQRQPDPRDEEVDAQIERGVMTVIVVLPTAYTGRSPLTGVSVLDELRQKYPTVVFILDCGRDLPAPGSLPTEPLRLEPALDLDEEQAHYDVWQSTGPILMNLPQG